MPEGKEKKHPIQNIKGVGPKIADTLSNLGIYQVQDAVFHLPYKYEDRTNLTPIGDAPYETPRFKPTRNSIWSSSETPSLRSRIFL